MNDDPARYEWFNNSNWESKKNNFITRFPVLVESDLSYDLNESDAMLDKLRHKLGMSSDELHITVLTL